jgi:hypothetical protein
MFNEILVASPFLALASCIVLGITIAVVCTKRALPDVSGFGYERKKRNRPVRMARNVRVPVIFSTMKVRPSIARKA